MGNASQGEPPARPYDVVRLHTESSINFSEDPDGGGVTREARLLVAGSYPAKNLTVTEADLDLLVSNFSAPIPVKVEHIDSPLDPLGLVESVRREGSALLGTVRFPASIAAFLSSRGAAKLSVGLLKQPRWRLLEASLTLSPHVPTATLLSDGDRSELVELRQQLRKQTVDAQISELKLTGRVIPATEAMARLLLQADGPVTLSDGSAASAADTFFQFLKAQPPLVRLEELATVQLNGGAAGVAGADPDEDGDFSDDDLEVLKRLGVDPDKVKTTMASDRKKKLVGSKLTP